MSAQDKSPEEKYRILIIVGIIFSILLIIGIAITFAVTRSRIAQREDPDMQTLTNQINDIISDTLGFTEEEYTDASSAPYGYYLKNPSALERESDSLGIALKKSCMNCEALDSLLRYIRSETDLCAKEIRDLKSDFEDTLSQPGVLQTFVTSEEFFSSTGREEKLLEHLTEFRQTVQYYALNAGTDSPELYNAYLPLTDPDKVYVETQTWDRSVFTEEPVDVILFLDHLELDLRYFENGILWGTVH
ncbi:MAG: hypothetical protein RL007_2500 [Bacteroidota bacterium]|jgi:hypothetical protein